MKKRTADSLKKFGYTGAIEEFCPALAEIKAKHFADWPIGERCYTRNEAAELCRLVKQQVRAPRLSKSVILRFLVGIRKNKAKAKLQIE